DHFKLVNDTYGHNRGDVVLKDFTNIIKNSIRDSDYLIRWGGEEFIVLMRVNAIESLCRTTENIRQRIEDYHFEEVDKITSSFGLTLYLEGEEVTKTIERADKALYIAKENGRNQLQVL
ncbi:MAG: GGDEF domain-containing protein, partial [Campylobacterota bacterium]|nr:GGDEF domain-containing protein [Campylobacterota bacterium]